MIRIATADLDDPRVVEMIRLHTTTARQHTAMGSAHALDLKILRETGLTLWTAWEDDTLLGMGALKRLSPEHGEIKSMHTLEAFRGQGVGRAMLAHIIATARDLGLRRLSLETGSWDYFLPARRLYEGVGFVECPPFDRYVEDPNSVFMTLELG